MPQCAFTGDEIPFGTGKMYVKKDGKILWFKDKRAEKNFIKLKRSPRDHKYTAAARQAKRQHMAELKHEAEAEVAEAKPVKKVVKKVKKAKKTVTKKTEEVVAEEKKT